MKYYFEDMQKTPILIGAHCAEPFYENKINHFYELVKLIKNNNFFLVVVSSSKMPRNIVDLCDVYIETFNYIIPHYGVSVSMQTEIGLNILKYHMFDSCLRLEYDSPIDYDYTKLINRLKNVCELNNKKFVSANWGDNGVGTGNFYLHDIDFLLKNIRFFSFKTGHENFYGIVETLLKEDLIKSGAINQTFLYEDYRYFYELDSKTQKYQAGGTLELY